MTIVFTPSGGSAVHLAGAESDGADGPSLKRGSVSQLMQVEAVTGAAKPAVHDRGNRRVTQSFQSMKAYADYEAAQAAILTHMQAILGKGTCVFTQGTAVLTLTDAFVTAEHDGSTGCSVLWSYTVEGSL